MKRNHGQSSCCCFPPAAGLDQGSPPSCSPSRAPAGREAEGSTLVCVSRAQTVLLEINLALISMGFGGIRARSTFCCLVFWHFQVIFNSFAVKCTWILKMLRKKRKQIILVDLKSHFYSFDIKPSASFEASLQGIVKKYLPRWGEWFVLNSLPWNPSTTSGLCSLSVWSSMKMQHLLSIKKSPSSCKHQT